MLLKEVEDGASHLQRIVTLILFDGLGAAPDADLEGRRNVGLSLGLDPQQGGQGSTSQPTQPTSTFPESFRMESNSLTMKASR